MKRRRRAQVDSIQTDEIGSDSFLDTIANLVGVLIILVVLVGAQSRNAPAAVSTKGELANQIAGAEVELRSQQEFEQAARSEQDRLVQLLDAENKMLAVRSAERQQALVTLQLLEQELAARREQMAASEQSALQSADAMQQLYRQLADVQARIAAVQAESVHRETIEHYPTPIQVRRVPLSTGG
jgi:2-keto-3-deoxy-galactonokinase